MMLKEKKRESWIKEHDLVCFIKTVFPNPIHINSVDTLISCSGLPIIPQALALQLNRGLIYIDRHVETKYVVRNQDLSCFSFDLD